MGYHGWLRREEYNTAQNLQPLRTRAGDTVAWHLGLAAPYRGYDPRPPPSCGLG